jgi:tetratricopeptide (TPR) repeat protein
MEPEYLPARRLLAAAYLQTGRERQAIAELERARARAGEARTVIADLAYARARIGERGPALALVEKVTDSTQIGHIPHYQLALAWTALGNLDGAFAALQQAAADRDPAIINIAVDPRLDPIRSDPRLTRLMDQMGL